ncbi:MAG: hypothetical protein KDA99_21830, partial [Planctomycetales bacterium]|nr:hypothetical protein [Planctomycetales bacterium]
AQTTVSSRSGQTIILGGLITKNRTELIRGIPLVSDIPVLGDLFKFESYNEGRTELMIILTPYIIRDESDMEMVKQVELQRMSWCLCDVTNIHGDVGPYGMSEWDNTPTEVIYPDQDPTGTNGMLPSDGFPPDGSMPMQMDERIPMPMGGGRIQTNGSEGVIEAMQAGLVVPVQSPRGMPSGAVRLRQNSNPDLRRAAHEQSPQGTVANPANAEAAGQNTKRLRLPFMR